MSPELKKERLDLRLPAAAKEQIERAAELQGRVYGIFSAGPFCLSLKIDFFPLFFT